MDNRFKDNSTAAPRAERIALEIVFEDADVIVVDKPAGMVVHPAPGHESGTLVNALLHHCPKIAGVGSRSRPGVVHRLDQETSGVIVAAKTERAYFALRSMFERHAEIEKTYLAVLHGTPNPKTGVVDAPIGRKPWDARRMAVDGTDARPAVTKWKTLGRQGPISLVEFRIETGRTHQIRVHAAHIGHPIAGDSLYGDPKLDRRLAVRPRRTLLHALALAFPHPVTGRRMEFFAEPPADVVYAH